jgi:protein-tyrosine phosphatase
MNDPSVILFLCTGNYYRSRFAAVLFSHLACEARLNACAESRGLRLGWPGNLGAMSPLAEQRLDRMGISFDNFRHMPMQCRACDLERAATVIALKEAEHRPMIAARFPGWEDRVTYWHIHDVDKARPEEALGEIETRVRDLIRTLQPA